MLSRDEAEVGKKSQVVRFCNREFRLRLERGRSKGPGPPNASAPAVSEFDNCQYKRLEVQILSLQF